MTRAESQDPERPFPGANSMVPGRHTVPATSENSSTGSRNTLPLGTVPIPTAHGWSIRLPIRAEQVTVTKDVVVRERVMVRRRQIPDVARVEAEVRREELRTSIEGEPDVVDAQTVADDREVM